MYYSSLMVKLLIFLFVVWVVWSMLKRRRPETSAPRPMAPADGERMVRCAHCGLNVPEAESLAEADRSFCSEEHRRLGGPT